MQERHRDRKQYFKEQGITTRQYVIPYIEQVAPITAQTRVLEIGCAEGGNLVPFLERGCPVVGVDLNGPQIERAKEYLSEAFPEGDSTLYYRDIYEIGPEVIGHFDLIIMRDVIEHIHDQAKFLKYLKGFLTENGHVFFGFPPWYMPFGGHQQVCQSKLSKVPWFHLLPMPLYKGVLKAFGEPQKKIDDLVEIKETGISIERFNRILKKEGYRVDKRTYYLINPNYEIKFGLTPRKQFGLISALPFVRNFMTTCCYCLISNR